MGKFHTFSCVRNEPFERIVSRTGCRRRANYDDLGLCRYGGKQHPEGADSSAKQKEVDE
jgi:hypothetical protein